MPSSGASWLIRWCLLAAPLDKEEPRIPIPRTPVNRRKKGRGHSTTALLVLRGAATGVCTTSFGFQASVRCTEGNTDWMRVRAAGCRA
jgi:hypothetical protein